MGCIVVQTETSTTVTGPKSLKPIGEIDMESMTDAFMTAAVLAAVANKDGECITKINGIANQRVKECNRIEAMITEFKKLGIEASELTDGLQIHGIAKVDLKYPAHGIYSYDDHRIAMSFSVLSCAYQGEGPIITQKVCVEKTWPGWWDQLKHNLGCTFTGIDLHPEILPFNDVRSRDPNASIVLIGMRGAGKSHMGKAAAKILNRKFIDLDDYFEQVVGINIPAFVKTSGWELFREKETELLKKALEENSTNFVISCGGGVVEAEVNRNILKSWIGIVIHIQRDLNAIAEYLEIDTTRPSYAIPLSDTWIKRKPWYQECSSLEYFVLSPSDQEMGIHYRKMEQEFGNFLKFALSSTKFEYPAADSTSFFVCLTCPNVNEVTANLDSITTGVDAVELRVDLLKSFEPGFIAEQIALIRHFSLGKPIVYTVRTKAQGGNFPDNNPEEMIDLLKFGIKCGCEYIDIEFTEPYSRFDEVLKSIGNSRVIGSYHDVAGNQTWTENGTMVNIYKELHKRSDIVKLIGRAHELSDNFTLHQFVNTHVKALQLEPKPIIALLMGASGQLSRHLNNFLTPVTHPLLTTAAAPGQVSVSEIHQTRHNIGLLPAKSFCLFGSPISQSMSPTIHNTGYEILGLPFNYSLEETSSVNDVEAIMRRMNGASVTIPLKVDVLKSRICSEIDPEARKIGAINTLTKTENGIRGSNTDWIGIKACIEKHIQHDIPTIGGYLY